MPAKVNEKHGKVWLLILFSISHSAIRDHNDMFYTESLLLRAVACLRRCETAKEIDNSRRYFRIKPILYSENMLFPVWWN